MKKLFFYINLFIIYLLLIIPVKAQFDIKARSVILQDYLSGKILYEKSPDLMIFPASMTKIMTTIITFELLQKGMLIDNKAFTGEHISISGRGTFVLRKDKVWRIVHIHLSKIKNN